MTLFYHAKVVELCKAKKLFSRIFWGMDCTVSTKRETVFLRSGVKGRKTGASCRCAVEKIRVSLNYNKGLHTAGQNRKG
jgi:hypothetical protein